MSNSTVDRPYAAELMVPSIDVVEENEPVSILGRPLRWIADAYASVELAEKNYPTALLGLTVGSFISHTCCGALLSTIDGINSSFSLCLHTSVLFIGGAIVLCLSALISPMLREDIGALLKFFAAQHLCGSTIAVASSIIGVSKSEATTAAIISGALCYLLLYLPTAHDNSALFGTVRTGDLAAKVACFLGTAMIWSHGLFVY